MLGMIDSGLSFRASEVSRGISISLSLTKKNNNNKTMNNYYVYMLANKYNNVLYTGVTNDLVRRVYEHKNKFVKGFTYKYNVDKLVYFEQTENSISAIAREKQIKNWGRAKKEFLVNKDNSEWRDLSGEIY